MTSEAQSKDNKITEQANEIKELAALVGGNSLDLAKQAEEARRANLLSEEVKYIASLSLF
jgi:quinolinate synthase